MKITFSEHAIQQRVERKITQKAIIDTIKYSDYQAQSYRGRKLFQKRFNAKILEVVAIEETNELIIVTAYYLKEESKL